MKMMTCPMNGRRNINEFLFGGEVEKNASSFLASDEEWARSLFYHYNATGCVLEWWQHRASGYWFIAERNRLSNSIIRTFDPQEFFDKKLDYHALVVENKRENDAGQTS